MSRQKAKGTAFENEIVKAFAEAGFHVLRTGKIIGHPHDVEVYVPAGPSSITSFTDTAGEPVEPVRIECKRRARAWKELYGWLAAKGSDLLAIRADRQKPLVVMSLGTYMDLLREIKQERIRRLCQSRVEPLSR